jgi:tRNA uridine 5-carboxymethylaminomethyl modification enzyme
MQELYDMEKAIENEISRVKKTSLPPSEEVNAFLASKNSTQISTGINLAELVRRPELSYQELAVLDREREPLSDRIAEQVNIEIKYEGYISRQMRQVEQFKKTEEKKIPADIDYDDVKSLRLEARQKLKAFRPESIGQASRIAGVTPADANVLLVYLKQNHM